MKYPGLRLLVSGAILDRDFFNKDFLDLLEDVKAYGKEHDLDLQLDTSQVEAACAAHEAKDMQQVFALAYWPVYDQLRQDGTIPQAAAFWEM